MRWVGPRGHWVSGVRSHTTFRIKFLKKKKSFCWHEKCSATSNQKSKRRRRNDRRHESSSAGFSLETRQRRPRRYTTSPEDRRQARKKRQSRRGVCWSFCRFQKYQQDAYIYTRWLVVLLLLHCFFSSCRLSGRDRRRRKQTMSPIYGGLCFCESMETRKEQVITGVWAVEGGWRIDKVRSWSKRWEWGGNERGSGPNNWSIETCGRWRVTEQSAVSEKTRLGGFRRKQCLTCNETFKGDREICT